MKDLDSSFYAYRLPYGGLVESAEKHGFGLEGLICFTTKLELNSAWWKIFRQNL